jgi:hypothetical protein
MPAKNDDPHGSAPDKSDFALLLIDVISSRACAGNFRVA